MATFDENIDAAIQRNDRLTFERVLRAAAETMTPRERAYAYRRTGHGVVVYTELDQLDAYLVAYGEMHQRKLNAVFQKIDGTAFSNFARNGISIVDWGCGQGLATLVFLDWLNSRNGSPINIQAIRLLEMSDAARNRAWCVVTTRLGDVGQRVVSAIPWVAGEVLTLDMFHLPAGVPVVHLFSNILDVAAIDLKNVANVVEAAKCFGPSLVVSASPRNAGAERLSVFWQMLGKPDRFACSFDPISLNGAKYVTSLAYCTNVGMGYMLEGLPRPRRYEGVVIYHVFDLGGDCDAAFGMRPPEWGHYRYSSPGNADSYSFDAENVPPVLAVLNNIVARGNPARAGLKVEEWLVGELDLTCEDEGGYGSYFYRLRDGQAMRPILESVKDRIDPFKARPSFTEDERAYERLLLTPILVSRVQHAVLRGIMSGQVTSDHGVVKVLAVEHDVPCARVALEELGEMLSHITALVTDDFRVETYTFDVVTCHPDEVAAHQGERFDIVLDVAFYANSAMGNSFSLLDGLYSFGARIETARPNERSGGIQVITGGNIVYKPVAERLRDGTYRALDDVAEELRYFLRNIFRKRDFRSGQLPILNRALQDRSVIGLLPTGGGKSLTYQLAGMMQPGVVIVIDPLRSLMKDQYDGLVKSGITASAYINSAQSKEEQIQSMMRVVNGKSKFLLVSPERLTIPGFRKELLAMYSNGIYFSYGVVDEVHCVSEWGHDFRFTYLHLGRNLHRYVRRKPSSNLVERDDEVVPLFGLTATASFDVLSDVERELSGPGAYVLDADSVVRYENTNRLELQYRVERIEPPAAPGAQRTPGDVLADAVARCRRDLAGKEQLLAANPNNPGLQSVVQSARIYLRDAERKLRNHYAKAKEAALADSINHQQQYFDELLTSDNLKEIRERFRERESIDPKSPVGQQIERTELDARVDVAGWTAEVPDYSTAALVFCPYKGFKIVGGEKKPPSPLTVESVVRRMEKRFPGAVVYFTGSTEDPQHDEVILANMDAYIQNRASLMIATTAFGMGIDKPNIRFVVEMNHPKSLEAFVQEAGRAGRDRKMALATIYLSGYPEVDLDIVDFFHKQNFIGLENEEKRIAKFLNETNLSLEEEDGTLIGGIDGFLQKLMSVPVGESIVVKVPYQIGNATSEEEKVKEQDIYDKLVYRLCCIGLVEDVECIYPPGGAARELRLRLRHLEEGGYFKALENFLLRYFNRVRADAEIEIARNTPGNSEIGRCMHYLEKFVYDNIQRKRRIAMEDMNAFCREGLRAYDQGNNWLKVNEDLKDFIYYYFNSKYARSGYETPDGKKYSLLDDTDSGKNYDWSLVKKYMGVIDVSMQDGASSKDNVKHLLGAVRHIARGALETNPVLSVLHAFCLCYLGFNGNQGLVVEAIRRLGPEGIGSMIDRKLETASDAWSHFRWLHEQFKSLTDVDDATADKIFAAARTSVHVSKVRALMQVPKN